MAFGHPGLGLGQTHKLSRVKPSPLDNWISNDNTDINKKRKTVVVNYLYLKLHNMMSSTMMTVFVRLIQLYFVSLLITLHLGITFYTQNDIRTFP